MVSGTLELGSPTSVLHAKWLRTPGHPWISVECLGLDVPVGHEQEGGVDGLVYQKGKIRFIRGEMMGKEVRGEPSTSVNIGISWPLRILNFFQITVLIMCFPLLTLFSYCFPLVILYNLNRTVLFRCKILCILACMEET